MAGARFSEPWQARTRAGVPIKPATWRIVATFPDGENVLIARRGSSDAEAYERIDALRRRPYGDHAGVRWTMQAVWDQWWTWTQAESLKTQRTLADGSASRGSLTWQDSTRLRYRGIWERHLAAKWGSRDPSTITRAEIYEWLQEPRSVQPKMLLDALRVVCRHAENRGISPHDPTRGGFQLTSKRPEPRPLSSEELDRIEDHLKAIQPSARRPDPMRLYDGWVILRSSAARISEMLSLQVQDFDPVTESLYVGRRHIAKRIGPSGRSTLGLVEGTKTRAGVRRVPLTPDGIAVLTARSSGKRPTDFIIEGFDGRWVSTNSFSNALFREMKRIGIVATAHDLRDTLSTTIARELVERRGYQAGLLAAARHLGHSSTRSLPAYVDESQVIDAEMADIVAATDPGARRLSEIQSIALGLNIAGLGAAEVQREGELFVVSVAAPESELGPWHAALSKFGDRVRIEWDWAASVQF